MSSKPPADTANAKPRKPARKPAAKSAATAPKAAKPAPKASKPAAKRAPKAASKAVAPKPVAAPQVDSGTEAGTLRRPGGGWLAVGVGSAALVAALLFATRAKRNDWSK